MTIEPRPILFASCPGQRLRIGVQSDHLHRRMKALDEGRQRSRAAPHVEHVLARTNSRFDEHPPGLIAADQLDEAGGGAAVALLRIVFVSMKPTRDLRFPMLDVGTSFAWRNR